MASGSPCLIYILNEDGKEIVKIELANNQRSFCHLHRGRMVLAYVSHRHEAVSDRIRPT